MLIKDFKSVASLIRAFPDEQSCINYLEQLRWKDKVVSPFNEKSTVYKCKNNKYKCRNSNRYFSVKTGTIFEETKIPMLKWFVAIYYVTAHKKGVSSCQLARDIDVTQRTAWFIIKRIQSCLSLSFEWSLQGVVQIDETFVGGKNKNRHKDKKVKYSQGRSFKDKTPVLGMISDDGVLITKVVENTSAKILMPELEKHIQKGSIVYTDEWMAYNNLKENYTHGVVMHCWGQYANGDVTTNRIEGYWSHLKRMIIGVHHFVSRKHLQYYLDGQSFRYMTRTIKDSERFQLFMQNTSRRLKYKNLVA